MYLFQLLIQEFQLGHDHITDRVSEFEMFTPFQQDVKWYEHRICSIKQAYQKNIVQRESNSKESLLLYLINSPGSQGMAATA